MFYKCYIRLKVLYLVYKLGKKPLKIAFLILLVKKKTKQNKTKQNKTKQNKTKQKQNKAKYFKTKHFEPNPYACSEYFPIFENVLTLERQSDVMRRWFKLILVLITIRDQS